MDAPITFQFTVCFLPRPANDPSAVLDALLAGRYLDAERVANIDNRQTGLAVAARIEDDPLRRLAHPDQKLLREFCRWISQEEAQALLQSEQAFLLDWSLPWSQRWRGLQTAVEVTHAVAVETGGLIRDETTREFFSPATWHEQRACTGDGAAAPDAAAHTMIHAYKRDGFLRAVTLGMRKFGLPDLAVRGFTPSLARNIGQLINLAAQALVEGATIGPDGYFDLDMHAIANTEVRNAHLSGLLPGATCTAPLILREVEPDSGVDFNSVLEITFDRGNGDDVHARQTGLLAAMFGSQEDPVPVEHDEVLQAASRAARERLPELREQFEQGLAPGSSLLVKGPFRKPDEGQEWMWVEVAAWKDATITGVLMNEPAGIPHLQAGQVVKVAEADVFDYILRSADGTTEGNETGKLIQHG